jgi:hypothetical protein
VTLHVCGDTMQHRVAVARQMRIPDVVLRMLSLSYTGFVIRYIQRLTLFTTVCKLTISTTQLSHNRQPLSFSLSLSLSVSLSPFPFLVLCSYSSQSYCKKIECFQQNVLSRMISFSVTLYKKYPCFEEITSIRFDYFLEIYFLFCNL